VVDQKVIEHQGVYISGIKYVSKAGLRHLGGLRESINRLLDQTGEGFKILMLHQEFHPFFPESDLYISQEIPEGFDYVGIGHYHIAQEPALINGAFIVQSGSTEFTAYHESEEKKEKGVYIVNVENDINAEFVKLKDTRPFISILLNEERLEDNIIDLKEKLEKILSSHHKKPVVIFKGRLKSSIKDILKILEKNKLRAGTDHILHFNFNISREIQIQNEKILFENEDRLLSEELKRMIGDKELYSSVKEVVDHLKTFESIDEAKKYLKENPDLLEI
jgi:hypothetical protein